MEAVSQREMRNRSGELLRRVAAGESVIVTNNGVPAAVLMPYSAGVRAQLVAAGRLRVGTGLDLSALPSPVSTQRPTDDLLTEDRER